MGDYQQQVVLFAKSDQTYAKERSGREIKRALGFRSEILNDCHFLRAFGIISQAERGERKRNVRVYDLLQLAVIAQ